jgi:hypothetical protein
MMKRICAFSCIALFAIGCGDDVGSAEEAMDEVQESHMAYNQQACACYAEEIFDAEISVCREELDAGIAKLTPCVRKVAECYPAEFEKFAHCQADIYLEFADCISSCPDPRESSGLFDACEDKGFASLDVCVAAMASPFRSGMAECQQGGFFTCSN